MTDQSHWRLNTADEITVELSQCTVSLDHVSTRDEFRGAAVLSIVQPPVVSQVIDLTPADLRKLASACIEFADKLDDIERAAAAEPSEPQESRQDSGTGKDAPQDAPGFYGTGWYRLRSAHPPVVYVDTADLHHLLGTYNGCRDSWLAGSGEYGLYSMDIIAGPFDTEAEALAWSPEPQPEDADGRMMPELEALKASGHDVRKAEPAETWGVLLDIDEDERAFHIIGTKEQAERFAYDTLVSLGLVSNPAEESWQEILWEVIDNDLEFRQIEVCPLAKDLDTRVAAFLETHLPEQTQATQSEVAEALYCDAAINRKIAAVTMDRLEKAGMRIIKETPK